MKNKKQRAEELKSLLAKHKLTNSDFALIANESINVVANWVSGRSSIPNTVFTVIKLWESNKEKERILDSLNALKEFFKNT